MWLFRTRETQTVGVEQDCALCRDITFPDSTALFNLTIHPTSFKPRLFIPSWLRLLSIHFQILLSCTMVSTASRFITRIFSIC